MFDPLAYFDDDEHFDTNVIFVHKAHAVLKVTIVHPCPTHSLFISPFPSPLLPPLPLPPSLFPLPSLSLLLSLLFSLMMLSAVAFLNWNDTS